MSRHDQRIDNMRALICSKLRVGQDAVPEKKSFDDGVLTQKGEAENVSVEKLVCEHAAAVPVGTGIIERFPVKTAVRIGHGETRGSEHRVLMQETAFWDLAI